MRENKILNDEKRTRVRWFRIVAVAVIVAAWSTVGIQTVMGNHSDISTLEALVIAPGWFMSLPVVLPGTALSVLVFQSHDTLQDAIPSLLWIAVLLTTVLWTIVAYMLNFNPPKFSSRRA